MPVMSGLEFYNQILDKDENPLYPVFVLTSRNDLEALFRDLHVNGFLVKPLKTKEAVDEILAVLDGKVDEERERKKLYDSVLIVDHNPDSAKEVMKVFKEAKFRQVLHAQSAVEGIELTKEKNPKLVLVQLNLPDIQGDMAILRMTQIFKTSKTLFFLITPRDYERKYKVMDRLESKSGVVKLIQYNKHIEILQELEGILKNQKAEDPHSQENEVLLDLMLESARRRNAGGGFSA